MKIISLAIVCAAAISPFAAMTPELDSVPLDSPALVDPEPKKYADLIGPTAPTQPVDVGAQEDVAEVRQTILDTFDYTRTHLKGQAESYSSEGALEFWSSGGLLNEIKTQASDEAYDIFTCRAKHIHVISLGAGVAVAHYYSEGAMKPEGLPAVPHYLTRASQVFVKEDGKWKVRSSHWSAVEGGSGTTQTAARTKD